MRQRRVRQHRQCIIHEWATLGNGPIVPIQHFGIIMIVTK